MELTTKPAEGNELSPANQSALRAFDTLPDTANVRLPVVAALHGISKVTVWRWSKNGHLPAPVRTGGITAWNVGALRRARQAQEMA